jgi:2-hydroxy-3-keto-5-methylthiopentenyl-1-phosphate phosphatase
MKITNKKAAILCDFDGTISTQDVGDTVVSAFSKADWEKAENQYRRGEIGTKELYHILYKDFDIPYETLKSFIIENIELDPYFKELIEYAAKRGMDFAVLSDGFRYYIDILFEKYNIGNIPVYSNQMDFSKNTASLIFPNSGGCLKCGTCKSSIYSRYKAENDLVIFIGDGFTDQCVAGKADILFAKSNLEELCRQKGWHYYPYANFKDVINTLETLLPPNLYS